jgi:hypothetical protein
MGTGMAVAGRGMGLTSGAHELARGARASGRTGVDGTGPLSREEGRERVRASGGVRH